MILFIKIEVRLRSVASVRKTIPIATGVKGDTAEEYIPVKCTLVICLRNI